MATITEGTQLLHETNPNLLEKTISTYKETSASEANVMCYINLHFTY